MLRTRILIAAALALVTLAVAPRAADAQIVEGRVVEADGRVLVSLVDADGRARLRRVTDHRGVFQFPVPGEGRYRVRVDRVGFEPELSGWTEVVGRERAELSAPFPNTPVDLNRLPSPEVGQCRAVGEIPDRLSGAWVEVEQALRLVKWGEDGGEILLDAEIRGRQLETDGETVALADPVRIREGVQRVTPPVSGVDLIERGFIREAEDGSYRYFGVTPDVLLDPAFHDTHCFRLIDEGSVLGVAFEPLPRETSRADVAGVIWVESTTGTPLALEYGYRNVDPTLVPANASGRSTFARMPDGSWILPDSWLRMPLLQVRDDVATGEQSWSVVGLQEERVRVLRVRSGGSTWNITPESSRIVGEVRSRDGRPLSNAEVVIVGTPWRTATDPEGRFAFENLLEGDYRVSVEHPQYDDLPLGPGTQVAELSAGGLADLRFVPPSPADAAAQLCGGAQGVGGSVILTGQVTDSLTGQAIVGLSVGVRFPDPRRDGTPWHEARVATGAGGYYVYCDAPAGQTVRLRPQVPGSDFQDDVTVLASGGIVQRDFQVELSTEASSGAVFGLIRDLGTGRPIEQAQVTIQDSGRSGLTNTNGFFSFDDVDPGTYVIEVSHLAYEAREIVVRVDGGTALQVNVELTTDAIELEGITVSVLPSRLFSDMVDLQRRMELGFGEFLVRSDLEVRGGTLGSALTGLAGVRVLTGSNRAGERYVILRSARDLVDTSQLLSSARSDLSEVGGISYDYCFPAVWVDGRRFSRPRAGGVGHDPVDFSQFVTVEVEAVEIYRGAGSVPGEFGGGDAACGAVVIWTRRGGRTVRGEMESGRGGGGTDGMEWHDGWFDPEARR